MIPLRQKEFDEETAIKILEDLKITKSKSVKETPIKEITEQEKLTKAKGDI